MAHQTPAWTFRGVPNGRNSSFKWLRNGARLAALGVVRVVAEVRGAAGAAVVGQAHEAVQASRPGTCHLKHDLKSFEECFEDIVCVD